MKASVIFNSKLSIKYSIFQKRKRKTLFFSSLNIKVKITEWVEFVSFHYSIIIFILERKKKNEDCLAELK